MFEDFSFTSSPSPERRWDLAVGLGEDTMVNSDSNLVSPLSSRCPSPVRLPRASKDRPFSRRSRSQFHLGPAPTSIPSSYHDHHRLSIGSLTRRLGAQCLENDDSRGYPLTPPTTAHTERPTSWLESEPLTPPDTDRD